MLDQDLTVTTTGFDVCCQACGWRGYVEAGLLEMVVAAHHLPAVSAVYVRYRGAVQVWHCRRPRPLKP